MKCAPRLQIAGTESRARPRQSSQWRMQSAPRAIVQRRTNIDELQLALGLGAALSSISEQEHPWRELSDALRRLPEVDTVAIFMVDEPQHRLVVARTSGTHARRLEGLSMAMGDRISGWVAATGQPMINAEAGLDLFDVSATALRAAIAVPCSTPAGAKVVLTLYSTKPDAFSPLHHRLLAAAASFVQSNGSQRSQDRVLQHRCSSSAVAAAKETFRLGAPVCSQLQFITSLKSRAPTYPRRLINVLLPTPVSSQPANVFARALPVVVGCGRSIIVEPDISLRDNECWPTFKFAKGKHMQRVIIFGLLSVLSVGQGVIAAQSVSDSALGAWTLNHAKSTFSGAVPYRRVTKFEVVGDAIKETTYTMSAGAPSVVVEYTARFDGNDFPISNSTLSTVSLKRVDDKTVERTGKVQGQVVETETRTVSSKGKVLTVTTKGNKDGAEYRASRSTTDSHDRHALAPVIRLQRSKDCPTSVGP